jgi:hypothetical protein
VGCACRKPYPAIFAAAVWNSLILSKKSLFFKKVSLLICVGNYWRSGCNASVSCIEIGSQSPKIAKFPVKFPVSREFAWRRVQSALRRQPGIPALGEMAPDSRRKARQWRAFSIRRPVSVLPISWNKGRIRGKSLAHAANIPVFRRLRPETGFDRHCVVNLAVYFGQLGRTALLQWRNYRDRNCISIVMP